MCIFITVAVAADSNLKGIAELAKRYGLGWISCTNKSVLGKLEKGSLYFSTTSGMCNCDTELGGATYNDSTAYTKLSSRVTGFRKKGWTESKIKNWLAEKRKYLTKIRRKNIHSDAGVEIENWRRFIAEILSEKLSEHIILLLHMYKQSIENERIDIQGVTYILADDLSGSLLLGIQQDRLYQFTLK